MILGQCKFDHPNGDAFAYHLENGKQPTSLIRVSINVGKRPSYIFPDDDTQKTITGLFQEPAHHMTFWEVREKANSMQTLSRFMTASRHVRLTAPSLDDTEQEYQQYADGEQPISVEITTDRGAPILEETTVICCSETFLPFDLAQITRKLRRIHIAFSDPTRLPFPLHEASKLANAIK